MVKLAAWLCAAWLLAGCAAHGTPKPGRVGGVLPHWSLSTPSGAKITDKTFAGRPLYLNFFATWCPPCNAEASSVNALQKKYAKNGLQVVGVDEAENAAAAASFVKKFHLVYPAIVDDGTLEDAFLVNGLPVHVFVGTDGVIREIRAGEMNEAQIEASIRAIVPVR